ncbi:hypothetical protein [Dermatobacter hominis]|uniref:hypothetical protein n=1 Tax=Dermatobacter hominis TaxID=2884263 RepID=UPI001D10F91D|nr:hypothetical protein [Dermatobacter hominis]UDY37322.1 hypothetical protein LH044_07235 [Dermatobacter hominis]
MASGAPHVIQAVNWSTADVAFRPSCLGPRTRVLYDAETDATPDRRTRERGRDVLGREAEWSTPRVRTVLGVVVAVLIAGAVGLVMAKLRFFPVGPGCPMNSPEPVRQVERAIESIAVPDDITSDPGVHCSYGVLVAHRSYRDSAEACEAIRTELVADGRVEEPRRGEAGRGTETEFCLPGTDIGAGIGRYRPSPYHQDAEKGTGRLEVSLVLPAGSAGCEAAEPALDAFWPSGCRGCGVTVTGWPPAGS